MFAGTKSVAINSAFTVFVYSYTDLWVLLAFVSSDATWENNEELSGVPSLYLMLGLSLSADELENALQVAWIIFSMHC